MVEEDYTHLYEEEKKASNIGPDYLGLNRYSILGIMEDYWSVGLGWCQGLAMENEWSLNLISLPYTEATSMYHQAWLASTI